MATVEELFEAAFDAFDAKLAEAFERGQANLQRTADALSVALARIERLEGLVAIHEQYLHDTSAVTVPWPPDDPAYKITDDGAHVWIGKPAQ